MLKLTIAVLFGGMSNEHDVSVISAKNVIAQMPPEYTVLPIYITREGRWFLYDGPLSGLSMFINGKAWEKQGTQAVLSADRSHKGLLRIVGGGSSAVGSAAAAGGTAAASKVKPIPVDCVFPVMHGKHGEDGCIQGLCELAGIPCVGSGVLASALCMDKSYTKIIAKQLGIKTADYAVFKDTDSFKEISRKIGTKIKYPCFIKPANGGSSVGMSKVNDKKGLEAALLKAFSEDKKVIAEKYIKGRELECAVMGTVGRDAPGAPMTVPAAPMASRVGEIIAANEWYDYESKYNDVGSETLLSPDLPPEVVEEIRSKSVKLFEALGCEGLARVDFFYDEENKTVWFSEINTMPGFTGISMFAMLWKADGISNAEIICRLVQLAVEK
jgi:D-alanine-D-alanine ligase